ncbi:hypothetical protein FSP39_021517 [Pinctada imbricata]|uniref:Sushi domain-containing protein n=1 Tax=Pinctada imbricata TaxID=66713 RepID=A0AA88XQ58_PINIB|nr:hypothetical protein FSP39_021517 [Pinctada imbricata]
MNIPIFSEFEKTLNNFTECPEPSAPQYGTVLSGNSSIGSSREIECTTGYAKLGAESGIICQHDQTWTTWTGTCSTCSNPSAISSAYIGSGTVTMGSQRTYYCNTGYQSNGYSATITCQSDATWTSTSFGCNLKATFDFEGFDTYSMEDYGAAYSWTRQSLIFQATKGGSSSSDWGSDIAVDLIQLKTSC